MAMSSALSSTRKNAAAGGKLEVRYEILLTGDGTATTVSLDDVPNSGIIDVDPDKVCVSFFNDDAGATVGPSAPLITFNTADDDIDFDFEFDTAVANEATCRCVVVMEYWDAAAQDGSSITAS